MKLERRSFFKVCLGAVAIITAMALPAIPEIPVAEAKEPDVLPALRSYSCGETVTWDDLRFECNDYMFRFTIKEYVKGAPIEYYYDQPGEFEAGACNKCMFEDTCMCNGLKFEKANKALEAIDGSS